jgi:hypothetical protein
MTTGAVSREKQFPNTAEGNYNRWNAELTYAKKQFDEFQKQGEEIALTFRDKRKGETLSKTRLNLFHANVTVLTSTLYGRVPRVDVDRLWSDANDDTARVASEMAQRMLNLDIEESGDSYSVNMRAALSDRLMPGLACARVRYCCEHEEVDIEPEVDDIGTILVPGYTETRLKDEWVEDHYVPWKDILWSPARYWAEVRWVAFRTYMDYDEVCERFNEDIAKNLSYTAKSPLDNNKSTDKEVWSKAEIWEIWDKKAKKVYWFCFGFDKIIDVKDDPLGLEGFWPIPMPMTANITTSEFMPIGDYTIAQDLYREIDKLQERIQSLTAAAKVVGVYDKAAAKDLAQLLKPGTENKMIAVDNWAMFAEKGGLKGTMDFLPLEDVVNAIKILSEEQGKRVEQLYQITGMSDIMRGASDPRASATQDNLKAKFSSVRIQALQDEFARFATDVQKLKFEIIAKHFDPQTIIKASNVMFTDDAQYAQAAVELIKNPEVSKWRIQIRSESLAMVDYAQIRQERSEYINALGLFLQSAAPISEKFPQAAPVLLELLKWGLAGFKGSNQIEGVLDQAIASIKQAQMQAAGQPPPPDPKTQAIQAQAQADQTRIQAQSQSDLQQIQAKAQADALSHQQELARHQSELAQSQNDHQQEMARIVAQNQQKMSEMIADLKAEMLKLQAGGDAELHSAAIKAASNAHAASLKEARTGMPNE